mmetsp:Transcript_93534/g.261645  ORF Transcript_93534/g.261645 Transcript_93534/m.261645 type:complete len:240 (+) Transcript_93534:525-1244(+)
MAGAVPESNWLGCIGSKACAVPPFGATSGSCSGPAGAKPKGFLLNCTAQPLIGWGQKLPTINCRPTAPPLPRTTAAAVRRPRCPFCPGSFSLSTATMPRNGGGGAAPLAAPAAPRGVAPLLLLLRLPPPSLSSLPDSSTYLAPAWLLARISFCTRAMFSRSSSSSSVSSLPRCKEFLRSALRISSGNSWYTDDSVQRLEISLSSTRGCVAKVSSEIVGRSLRTTLFAISGYLCNILQYM